MTSVALKKATVAYGAIIALEEASLELPEHGLVVVFGPNGSGKSTLLDLLSGAVRPSSGQIQDSAGAPIIGPRLRVMSARLHQRTLIPENVTGSELLDFADQHRSIRDLFGRSQPIVLRDAWFDLCEAVGAHLETDRPLRFLSGGQQRLFLLFATLLSNRPNILLDEPLAGLAPELSEALIKVICGYAPSHLVVVVDHESERLIPAANRLVGLRSGHVVLDCDAAKATGATIEMVYDGG